MAGRKVTPGPLSRSAPGSQIIYLQELKGHHAPKQRQVDVVTQLLNKQSDHGTKLKKEKRASNALEHT